MGIDIYLKWKNQTEAEEEAQITGFSIEDGHNGYLRASYGNREGCDIFYDLFQRGKWESGEPFEYDFQGNKEKMEKILAECTLEEVWKKSLRDFFALAITKTEPRVYVSY